MEKGEQNKPWQKYIMLRNKNNFHSRLSLARKIKAHC
jgi:hypothetical protein